MRLNLLLMLIFLMGLVSATSVTCVIVNDRVLVGIELTGGDRIVLPEEYSLLEIDGDKTSFISKDFIRHDGEWIFVLPKIATGLYDLEIVLPSGFVLSDGLIYPRDYELGSDGKSIILRWESVDEEVIVFYEGAASSYDFFYWVGIFCLVFLGFLFFKFRERKFDAELKRLNRDAAIKEKGVKSRNLVRNLFGEEKRIMEFLVKEKSCWMKDLVRELGLSKVMVTRKIRSLMEKGLVSGEKMGREMKISLVRK